jgi:signal transduction histidine kinase/ActR/RegA family two-component response regulator
MKNPSQPFRWYLCALVGCTLTISTIAFYLSPSLGQEGIVTFFLFLGLFGLVSFVPVRYNGRMLLSLATTIEIAAAWILPPIEVILLVLCGCLFRAVTRLKWYRVTFNICQEIIIVGGVAILFSLIAVPVPQSWIHLTWIVIVGVLYTTASIGLLGTVITLSNPSGYNLQIWQRNVLGVFTYIDVTLFACGVVLGVLWFVSPQAFALGLMLLGTMYWSLRSDADVHQATTHRVQIQESLTTLLSTTNVKQQLELILKQLWHLFPIENAGIVLFGDEGDDEPLIVAGSDAADLRLLCSQPDILLDLCKQSEIRRIDQEPVCAKYCKLPVLLIPLNTSDGVVGAMIIGLRKDTVNSLDSRLLSTYGAQAALAIMQARLIEQTKASQAKLILSERLAAVGTLAASLAHEFNNVLAIICTSADVAAMKPQGAAQLEALRVVSATARRGGSITRGLLTFTRQYEPHREHIEIDEAIDPVLAMLTTRFRKNQVTLVRELTPGLTLNGDVGLLSQAVLNLVSNALDAMPSGGTLTVKTWQDGQTLRLSVQDTGDGIPDEIRPRLFEPFTTTKHVKDSTSGGSGLGLAITHGIVTSHQGRIEVDSRRGEGTTICLALPAGEPIKQVAPPAPAPVPVVSRTGLPMRVVVVDDEPLMAKGLAQIIEMEGHEVVWFDQPEAALAEIERQPPDLLISDIQMPKIDGVTLLQRAKQYSPSMQQVLVTGQLYAGRRSEVLALGVQIVHKPFSATDIQSVLGPGCAVPASNPATIDVGQKDLPATCEESAEDEHLRADLRHYMLNQVSILEHWFPRFRRHLPADVVRNDTNLATVAQIINELINFVRSQRLLGLLDRSRSIKDLYHYNRPFSLHKLLNEVAEWPRSGVTADEAIEIQVVCPAELEMVGDSGLLTAALLAALQNASDSIRRRPDDEHLLTITASQAGNQVVLAIEDTGEGFPPALLDHITRHIDRGDGDQFIATLQPRFGPGLGIATMVRVAQVHGGRVLFGNRYGQSGAWAQFVLPLQPASQTENFGNLNSVVSQPCLSY